MKTLYKIIYLAIALLLASTLITAEPRIVLNVGEAEISPKDTLVTVPVYLDNPLDSLAGVEAYFKVDINGPIYFASDDAGSDGLLTAADTSGTLMSGWEWVGVSTLDNNFYDLKVSGMADWPDQKRQPPILPQTGGVWVNLVLRIDDSYHLVDGNSFAIDIIPEKTGFSDPAGNSIGIITTMQRVCKQFLGDSCLVWHNARVGILDTTIVKFKPGLIRVVDSLSIEN